MPQNETETNIVRCYVISVRGGRRAEQVTRGRQRGPREAQPEPRRPRRLSVRGGRRCRSMSRSRPTKDISVSMGRSKSMEPRSAVSAAPATLIASLNVEVGAIKPQAPPLEQPISDTTKVATEPKTPDPDQAVRSHQRGRSSSRRPSVQRSLARSLTRSPAPTETKDKAADSPAPKVVTKPENDETLEKEIRVFEASPAKQVARRITVELSIHYRANFGDSVGVVGSCAALGSWDASKAVVLHCGKDGATWSCRLRLSTQVKRVEYKVCLSYSRLLL